MVFKVYDVSVKKKNGEFSAAAEEVPTAPLLSQHLQPKLVKSIYQGLSSATFYTQCTDRRVTRRKDSTILKQTIQRSAETGTVNEKHKVTH